MLFRTSVLAEPRRYSAEDFRRRVGERLSGDPGAHVGDHIFNPDIADMLLTKNARPNAQTRQGVTPLMVAARLGPAEVVRLLLANKADPNKPDFTGRTGLTYARQSNRGSIEAMLRKAGGHE